MEAIQDPRFELVTAPGQAEFAACCAALLSFSGLELSQHTTLAGPEELRQFGDTLRCGGFVPVLFDNSTMLEISQPLAILRYCARLKCSETSAPASDALRSDLLLEAVLRFSKLAPPVSESTAMQHVRALQSILTQRSSMEGLDVLPVTTAGDVLAALYIDSLAGTFAGKGAAAVLGDLLALHEAWGRNPRIRDAIAAARKTREAAALASTTTTAAASVAAPTAVLSPPAAALPPSPPSTRVLVTGASGFIASWLVRALLARGYTVHATVRDVRDEARTEHLRQLEGAQQRLTLFSADLLVPGAFDAAMAGCECVFHCASPFLFTAKVDPEVELIQPAVEGTRQVMRSALACASVRRVVLTSSAAAVYVSRHNAPDYYYTEDDWSDEVFLRETKQHYALSKLLAEREAWRVVQEEAPKCRPTPLALVTICPTQTLGPLLQPSMNTSCSAVLDYLSGAKTSIPRKGKCFVDVRDVALAHVLAWENPAAAGRYLLMSQSVPWSAFADVLRRTLPGARVPKADTLESGPPAYPQAVWSHRRTHELGIAYTPVETSIRDCALSIYAKGLLEGVIAPAKKQ